MAILILRRRGARAHGKNTVRQRETGRDKVRAVSALLGAAGLLWAVTVAGMGRAAASGPQSYNEYEVKAAFIYNFAKFITWPAGAFERTNSPIVIGIVGKDPFGSTIDRTVEGKNVEGRPLAIKRLKWGPEMKDCHIVFVSSSEKGKIRQLADLLKSAPVLTVGETSGFAQRGGIINFILEGSKVRFEINPDAAKRAKLTISSRLLSLANIVAD